PLPHPEEDLEDQGLAFDVGTPVTRRGALGVLGAGSVAAVLAACSGESASGSAASDGGGASDSGGASASTLEEMPGETAGPYPGDGSTGPDVLETSGVERSDIRSSIDSDTTAEGTGLEITLNIIDMAGGDVPMEGAAVYLWHCDASGNYSLYSDGLEDETYLRGVQIADPDGAVTFTSIVPGCYAGRWPHIHVEVFADGWEPQLATFDGALEEGYRLSIDVPIDTNTEPEAGGAPGGGGEGGPGGEPPADAPDGGGPGGQPPEGGEGGQPPEGGP